MCIRDRSKVSPNKVYKGSEVDKEPEYPGGNQGFYKQGVELVCRIMAVKSFQ